MTSEEAVSNIKVMIESLELGIKAIEQNKEWEGIIPNVQPKVGKWIYKKEEDSYRCSLCGFPCHKDNLGAIPTEYCAGCGAVMEVWNEISN